MNIGFDTPRKDAIDWFFDRPAVVASLDRTTMEVFRRFGGYVRRISRNSIKTRRKTLKTMTKEERRRYRIAVAMNKRAGNPKPKPPRDYTPSKPGEPPVTQTGLLKENIFFHLDPQARSVIAGPVKLSGRSDAPRILEEGGMVTDTRTGRQYRIAPRPYMRPAYERGLKELDRFWREAATARAA